MGFGLLCPPQRGPSIIIGHFAPHQRVMEHSLSCLHGRGVPPAPDYVNKGRIMSRWHDSCMRLDYVMWHECCMWSMFIVKPPPPPRAYVKWRGLCMVICALCDLPPSGGDTGDESPLAQRLCKMYANPRRSEWHGYCIAALVEAWQASCMAWHGVKVCKSRANARRHSHSCAMQGSCQRSAATA